MKFSLAFVAVLALTGAVRAGPVIKKPNELTAVLIEFFDLVTVEPAFSIIVDYFLNDPEIHRALEYFNSEEFKNSVRKIESIEDAINLSVYLEESGLDVYGAINALHNAIGLPPLGSGTPTSLRTAHGGIAGLVDDIKAVLPLDDIEALYYQKLETSPAFAYFVYRLETHEFWGLIDSLAHNEEFLETVRSAQAAGLDILPIVDLLNTLFGLDLPSLTKLLNKDFTDFINLLPSDAVLNIHANYVNNDPEFKEIGRYVKTEEFAQKVQELASIKQVKEFIDYLQGSGINVYGYLELLHNALEIPSFESSFLARETNGIAGYITEIQAVLPTKEITALHQEKLKNSPAFLHLAKRLRSMAFYDNLFAVLENPQASDIIAVFKSHGINFIYAADLFYTVFGFYEANY